MRGIIALERGDLGAALRWLSEAVALSEAPEARFRRVVPWGFLAVARGLAGDAQGAATAAQETADAAALFPLAAGYAGRAAAWARVGAGDLTGAARAATAAAEANEAAGTRTTALWCAHDALRFAPGPSTAARVIELAVGVDGARAHAFTVHARAVVDTDPGALIAAADAFEALDARVHAAEVLELAATQLRADGLRDSARRAATRASALRDACGVAHSGGSLATDDLALASLTRREREAAALAASGLTNAQLAERLGVSVRTAEGHLANAMAKLDVSRRTELAGRLHVDRRSNADNA
jgi:DNA-binding CsgD family transcriptional regulator